MKNNVNFSYCYGCGVCATSCPKNAITIKLNENGFFKPFIDETCINCGICLKVCAFNHSEICTPNDKIVPYSAAAWSKDDNVRYTCTSGGAAYEIERFLLSQGFNVVVVRYDISEHKAEHYIARTETELIESIGSKYIQSQTYNAFRFLVKNQKYLVVGTPCQIDSLRRFIRMNKMEDNFILMDFFCHSVPSIKMWHKYIDMIGFKNIEKVKFRCKRNGWHDSKTTLIHGDGKEWCSSLSEGDLFYWFFLGDRCLNPSCIKECKYKQQSSAADLRIGDFWGNKYSKEDKGVNALVAFTNKGKNIIDNLEQCVLEPCDFETVAEFQMKQNAKPKRSYEYVLNALNKNISLKKIYRTATFIELPDTIPYLVKYYYNRIIHKCKLLFRLK